jgi:hypothetical protein
VSMLEEVCSSGVLGLKVCCRPPNCDPNDNEGRRDRLGVGSLGLVLMLEEYEMGIPWIKTEVCRHVSSQRRHWTE